MRWRWTYPIIQPLFSIQTFEVRFAIFLSSVFVRENSFSSFRMKDIKLLFLLFVSWIVAMNRAASYAFFQSQPKLDMNWMVYKVPALYRPNLKKVVAFSHLRLASDGVDSTVDRNEVGGQFVNVEFRNQTIKCREGELLRTSLLRNGMTPHNGRARIINCRGLGTCGTCAVEVAGLVCPPERTAVERTRLSLPPFAAAAAGHLRLACQLRIAPQLNGMPLQVTKYDGFWGHNAPTISNDYGFELPFGELEYILDPQGRGPSSPAK
jgi:ferredoxin